MPTSLKIHIPNDEQRRHVEYSTWACTLGEESKEDTSSKGEPFVIAGRVHTKGHIIYLQVLYTIVLKVKIQQRLMEVDFMNNIAAQ